MKINSNQNKTPPLLNVQGLVELGTTRNGRQVQIVSLAYTPSQAIESALCKPLLA